MKGKVREEAGCSSARFRKFGKAQVNETIEVALC